LDRLRQDDTMVCNFLTGDELDLAFGRANVIHAAVARGGLADKLTEMLGRVAAYEGLNFTDAKSEDR
jgi:hypothetical protein